MKASIVLSTLIIFLICSCRSNSKNEDVLGTYVTHFSNEYTNTFDTLIVKSTASDQSFLIERRTGFNKIRDGKPLSKEYKTTKWNATYDEDKYLLKETDLGRQIRVSPEKRMLTLGSSEYQKIK